MSDAQGGGAPAYDLLISGGEVVDPGSGYSGQLDVAIKDGKIAAVEAGIDKSKAAKVQDASGQYVTPGLIDLHTHIYWGATYWGIDADPVAARSGVTTWLDVGSSGSYNFPGFRRYVVEANKIRAFALLNISSIGLVGPTWELANLDYCDVPLATEMINQNRDIILGVKARIDKDTTRGTGIRPLQLARELADNVDLPLMVHIGQGPPLLPEIAEYLRPGDILTHCFTGHQNRIVDDSAVLPFIDDLHKKGLILDIGHGTGSFSFITAEIAIKNGFLPDVISTDIHQMAIQGPMFDMPTTLSKFLNIGMTLEQVIARATVNAAKAMRKPELGSLNPGSAADVALFRIEEGDFTFQDIFMNERKGSKLLVNTGTFVNGEQLPCLPERPLHFFAKLPAHQAGKVIPIRPVS